MAYIGSPAAPTIATVSDGTVTSNKLADDAVTSAKITDGAVTPTDLSTGHPNWDSSGNVGIGTSSPSTNLDIRQNTNADVQLQLYNNNSSVAYASVLKLNADNATGSRYNAITSNNGATPQWRISGGGSDSTLAFATGSSNTERMRIAGDGKTYFGSNTYAWTNNENYSFHCPLDGVGIKAQFSALLLMKTAFVNPYFIAFGDSSTTVLGSVTSNGSSVAFNTTSDYRLKENVVEVTDGINRVKLLKPYRFNFISNPNQTVDGFLAHEVSDVVPEAIHGTKDAMRTEEYEVTPAVEATYDEEGNELTPAVEAVMGTREVPDYQGIDQSKLVPLLTAALQEAITKIESLEARVATLESA